LYSDCTTNATFCSAIKVNIHYCTSDVWAGSGGKHITNYTLSTKQETRRIFPYISFVLTVWKTQTYTHKCDNFSGIQGLGNSTVVSL
jgi:hypothetical protein